LYNLLFKKRAQIDVSENEYSPTIIYKEKDADYTWLYFVGGYLIVSAFIGLIILINRKRLYY
jgi:hypothetical protein